jgi:hypothetical protein
MAARGYENPSDRQGDLKHGDDPSILMGCRHLKRILLGQLPAAVLRDAKSNAMPVARICMSVRASG